MVMIDPLPEGFSVMDLTTEGSPVSRSIVMIHAKNHDSFFLEDSLSPQGVRIIEHILRGRCRFGYKRPDPKKSDIVVYITCVGSDTSNLNIILLDSVLKGKKTIAMDSPLKLHRGQSGEAAPLTVQDVQEFARAIAGAPDDDLYSVIAREKKRDKERERQHALKKPTTPKRPASGGFLSAIFG